MPQRSLILLHKGEKCKCEVLCDLVGEKCSSLNGIKVCQPLANGLMSCDPFSQEWPPLASLVGKAQEPRGCLKRLSDTVRHIFHIANVTNPEDEGVIDHMVSVTTAMRSPFIAVACHTVSARGGSVGLVIEGGALVFIPP